MVTNGPNIPPRLGPARSGMSANPDPRHDARESYVYRRPLSGRELLPALAIGVGAGLMAFYVARLFAQRMPLVESVPQRAPRIRTRSAGVAGGTRRTPRRRRASPPLGGWLFPPPRAAPPPN